MSRKTKIKMPRTKAEFEEKIINAFHAGCAYGYGVEHTLGVYEQEHIGALNYVGCLTNEEAELKLKQLMESEDA